MTARDDPVPVAAGETLARAAVAVFVPYGGAAVIIYDALRERLASRGERTAAEILGEAGADVVLARIAESSEFEALMINAMDAAMRTGFEWKRRRLAQVVVGAALDDAKVDQSTLLVQVLRDIDAPHIRCLARLRDVENEVVGRITPDQYNTELRAAIETAIHAEPLPVRAALVRNGLVEEPTVLFGGTTGSIAGISDFGRLLLQDLVLTSDDEQS